MQFITSKDNITLKAAQKNSALNRSYRQENNLTIIEGPHLVEAYLDEKK
jgi:TrmH family RNA methyltransferase